MQTTKRLVKLGVLTVLATLGIALGGIICAPYDSLTAPAATTESSPKDSWKFRLTDTTTGGASINDPAYQARSEMNNWHTMPVKAKLLLASGKIERTTRPQAQYDALSTHASRPLCWCIPGHETQRWPR